MKSVKTKNLNKDKLVEMIDEIREELKNTELDYPENFYKATEAILADYGVSAYEEVSYTIDVTCKFTTEPDYGTVVLWLDRAFQGQFDAESCVFPPNQGYGDVFSFEVKRNEE